MALRLYFDVDCTNEVTSDNRDTVHKSVNSGDTMTDEISLWIKSDDAALAYENIVLTAQNDDSNVDLMYAPDSSGEAGTYADTITIPNGYFSPAIRIWRRVVCPNVTAAFERNDIRHALSWDEYVL